MFASFLILFSMFSLLDAGTTYQVWDLESILDLTLCFQNSTQDKADNGTYLDFWNNLQDGVPATCFLTWIHLHNDLKGPSKTPNGCDFPV